MDLDSMKYAELRNIAKELGFKANMKADKLLKMIKQHYEQEKNGEGEEQEDGGAGEGGARGHEDATSREEEVSGSCCSAVFVNTRRGKGNGTKRKISDTDTETECAAQGDTEVAASAAPCGVRGSKKRKVSPVLEAIETEPESPEEEPQAASAAPRGVRGSKKRKVSTVLEAIETEPEPPEEPQVTDGEQHPADVKDEAPVHVDTEKATKVAKAGRIPRYQGRQQKSKQLLKPVTPNFKKLHEAHFNKMESIDSYVQRKNKQMETYRTSVKELKKLSDKTKPQLADDKTQTKANRASVLSPVLVNKRSADEKRRHTLLSASKAPRNEPVGKEDAPFRPSVLSTRRINVRFSEATHDNEYKRPLLKTPARMSPCVTSSTPQKLTTGAAKSNSVKTSTFSATKTPGPYIFTGNTSTSATPGTQTKPNFDLKASLSRPLTYKPHAGKLKPFGDVKENAATEGNKSLISNSHQKNYKQHQVETREGRRGKHKADRKQKKESMLGARRGLVMM
ncbi:putative nucleolar and spindle-associated protein 1-like isoform 2 [Scophthalmus maximus]|uniref:Putative nucleolar and spindle-associated protein 1-like isoform 2 n=2 Tax=Scophthalmus maximus TaxID=52904 RepID=A0A2U9CJ84_SCOMX|nr:putative nucleolar and spindle-associated protein 1-like isoform 2 [Scophthalmus maximus]